MPPVIRRISLVVVLALSLPFTDSSAAGFVVVENTWSYRTREKPEPAENSRLLLNWQLGYLHHLDSRNSLGGSLKLQVDFEGERFGPVVRYRRWLDDSFGVDVGAGAYLAGSEDQLDYRLPMPTFELGVTYDDWIGIQGGVDVLRREASWRSGAHTHVEPYIGVRVGRFLAPAVTIAVPTVWGLLY